MPSTAAEGAAASMERVYGAGRRSLSSECGGRYLTNADAPCEAQCYHTHHPHPPWVYSTQPVSSKPGRFSRDARRRHVARTYTQPLSCATEEANTPDGCMMTPGSIRLRAFVAAAAGASASAVAIVSTTS